MGYHVKVANVFVHQALNGFGRHIRINALLARLDGAFTLIVAIFILQRQELGAELSHIAIPLVDI